MKIIIKNDTLKTKQFKMYKKNQYVRLNPKDSVILGEVENPKELEYYLNLVNSGYIVTTTDSKD